jgi:transposase
MTLLENVQQKTIHPIIQSVVKAGSLLYTDEYVIYDRVQEWG